MRGTTPLGDRGGGGEGGITGQGDTRNRRPFFLSAQHEKKLIRIGKSSWIFLFSCRLGLYCISNANSQQFSEPRKTVKKQQWGWDVVSDERIRVKNCYG